MTSPYRENMAPAEDVPNWRLRKIIRISLNMVLSCLLGVAGAMIVAVSTGACSDKVACVCEAKPCEPPPVCKSKLFINPPAGAMITCENGSEPEIVGASVRCNCPKQSPAASASAKGE